LLTGKASAFSEVITRAFHANTTPPTDCVARSALSEALSAETRQTFRNARPISALPQYRTSAKRIGMAAKRCKQLGLQDALFMLQTTQPAPTDRVIEPVIAPKEFTVNSERRRPENAQASRRISFSGEQRLCIIA
jgi:hypothetical protein